jgi:ABC-type transport system involved in multi-copper enzyme maturation permease subunit
MTDVEKAPAASGGRALARDVGLVARFELAEAMRSKLLVVMVLLFVGAGALGAWAYTEVLGRVEANAAKLTGAPTTHKPGAMVRRLRDVQGYRDMLRLFLGDDAKADYFATIPPIVVFFGWVSFIFTPWLVLFTSAETIATEVASRSIRYSALRTGRLEFALGKALGQLLIVIGVTALSAVMFYLVAWAGLSGFEHGATFAGLLSYWPRVVLYTLPFLGWAMLASMLTSSANLARIVSLGGAVVLAIVWRLVSHPPPWLRGGRVFEAVRDLFGWITPFGHYDGLTFPPGGALVSDIAVCLALPALYFAAGYAVLRRRDL